MVRLHLWSVPIHRLLCDNATVYHGNDRIPLQGYVRYRKKTFREIKLAYSSSRLAQYSYEILPNLFYSSDLVNLQSYAAGY